MAFKSRLGIGGVTALLGIFIVALNLRPAVTSISPLFYRIDAEVSLGNWGISVLGMVPTLMFGVAGFIVLPFVRRYGLEAIAVVSMALVAAGSVARAFAPTAVVLIIASTVALLGAGIGNIVAPPLVKKYFPHRLSAVGMVYTFGLQFGTVIPALVTVPLANWMGWRVSLGSWALLAVAAMVPWTTELVAGRRTRKGTSSTVEHTPARAAKLRAWSVPLGVSMAVFFGANSLLSYSFFTWLPPITENVMGMSAAAGGAALGLFSAIGLVAAIAVPIAAGKLANPFGIVVGSAIAYVVSFAGMYWAPTAAPWLWVVLLGIGPTTFPLLLTLFNLRTRTHDGSAALSGLSQGAGYILASFGPLVFGALWELGDSLLLPLLFLTLVLVVLVVAGWTACRPQMLEDELAKRHATRQTD